MTDRREKALNYAHHKAIGERQKEQFIEWLEDQENIGDVRPQDRCVDFRIGHIDIWPRTFDDDELNAIKSSSVADNHFGVETIDDEKFVTEVKIHLPPTREELQDDIDEVLDLPDGLSVFHGTTALGGMPAPDGVITPHILHTDNVTFETAQEGVRQALVVYEEVYNSGEKAIKEKP